MKKTLIYCLILLTAGILLRQCKPIDLTADYKDITVSYGILNIKDNVHYFKIYRGYITDGNANVAAGEWNNIYYPVDSIEVYFDEYENGHLLRSAKLDTTTVVPKDEGYFPNPKQLLYYSDWQLDPERVYRLRIVRHTSGDEIYAETVMVGNFSIRRPMVSWNMCSENPYKIIFYSAENAAMYDLYLTFYYIEVDNATGVIEHKQISRRINGDYIRATTGTEVAFTGFTPETFFTTIIQGIETNNRVTRYIDSVAGQPYRCMRLTAWAADKNYLTYREVSNPGSSIVQNRPEYTNFISDNETAYGLLASRNYAYADLAFDDVSGHNEDTLVKSPSTRRLNFDYYRNSPEFPNGPAQ
jgi:hypothetical protein